MEREQEIMSRLEEEYINKDRDYIIRPSPRRPHLSDLVITEAKGIILKDINGKEYMDMYASWNTCCIGHGRKEVVEAAMAQMSKFDFTPIAAGPITKESCDLAEKLTKVTPPGLNHFWFCDGGSEANDFALRLARLYWENRDKKERNKVISLTTSYHGATLGMRLVSGSSRIPSPDFIHIPPPYCYRCPWDKTYPKCDFECAQALAETIEKEGEDSILAFMCEPVMTITNIVPPEGYWSRVRKICTDHNILLITDEVMCGMGLTGKWWGCQAMNFIPDIMASAKSLSGGYVPFGMTVLSDQVYEGMRESSTTFGIAYTYSGYPVGCAVVGKVIDIMLEEKLVENAVKVGAHLQSRLPELMDIPCIGDVRGIGLLGYVEYVEDKATKEPLKPERFDKMVRRIRENGFVHYCGRNTVRFIPPRIVTKEQIDKAFDNLKRCAEEV